MSLTDELLKADVSSDTLDTKKFKSRALAKALGKKGEVEVTLRQIPERQYKEIMGDMLNRKGDVVFEKSMDTQLRAVVACMYDPDLKNKELMKHFGCSTPTALAEKLFNGEVTRISDVCTELCLGDIEANEEYVKN